MLIIMRGKTTRTSRLAVRTCLVCDENALVSNGAFWKCQICGFAATSLALTKDLQNSATQNESGVTDQEDTSFHGEAARLPHASTSTSRR